MFAKFIHEHPSCFVAWFRLHALTVNKAPQLAINSSIRH